MAAAGDVWLSSAAVFMWQRNAAGYDTKTFREDRHGVEEKNSCWRSRCCDPVQECAKIYFFT